MELTLIRNLMCHLYHIRTEGGSNQHNQQALHDALAHIPLSPNKLSVCIFPQGRLRNFALVSQHAQYKPDIFNSSLALK